jgi:hypothetical protein
MKILFSVFLSLGLAGLFAQDPQPQPPERPLPKEILTRYFQLDEAQTATLDALLETRRTDAQPIFEEMRVVGEALRELLQGENPDPNAVGELVLQEKDLREEMRAVEEAFGDGFIAMLSEEQMRKFNLLAAANRMGPIVEAARAIKLPLPLPEPPEGE